MYSGLRKVRVVVMAGRSRHRHLVSMLGKPHTHLVQESLLRHHEHERQKLFGQIGTLKR
jgi:hypothetical protein